MSGRSGKSALLALSVLLVVAASCAKNEARTAATPTATGPPTKMLIYTKEDNGETATMRVGDKLSITLAENAGTGYAWRITKSPAKSVLKKSVDGHVEPTPEPTGPPMAGRPGEHRWVFDAVGRGKTSIVISLFPPGGGKAAETFSVPVKVSG